MAHYIRTQVRLENTSGLNRDAAVNTLVFRSTKVDIEDSLDDIDEQIETFYQAIDGVLSEVLSGTVTRTHYNLTDPEPRAPIRVNDFAISTGAGDPLPNEVAICASFRGASVSGIPAARRRGRIFIGPLNVGALDAAAGDTRVASATRAVIGNAMAALVGGLEANDASLQVLSRTIIGPPPWTEAELNAATFTVVSGFVDDAFDTVRSRGTDPSARFNWP